MNFKEECVKEYKESEIRNKISAKERIEESKRTFKKAIFRVFQENFKRELTEKALIEKSTEYGSKFFVELDDIKLFCKKHEGGSHYANFHLRIPCCKCQKETSFRDRILYKTDIGKILTNLETYPDYMRMCQECKEKQDNLRREQRNIDYEKKKKERNQDTIKQLGDLIARLLIDAGYRDLHNYDTEEY